MKIGQKLLLRVNFNTSLIIFCLSQASVIHQCSPMCKNHTTIHKVEILCRTLPDSDSWGYKLSWFFSLLYTNFFTVCFLFWCLQTDGDTVEQFSTALGSASVHKDFSKAPHWVVCNARKHEVYTDPATTQHSSQKFFFKAVLVWLSRSLIQGQ